MPRRRDNPPRRRRGRRLMDVLAPRPQPAAPGAASAKQRLLASIDLFDEDIVLSQFVAAGGVERQYIEAEQIVQILAKAQGDGQRRRPLAPVWPGVLAAGMGRDGKWRWIVLRPAGPARYTVTVAGKERVVCLRRCPALVAELHGSVEHGAVRWTDLSRCFALGGDGRTAPAGGERLYLPPFGDIESNGAIHLCGIEWERSAGLDAAATMEAVLFRSRFTGAGLDRALSDAGRKRYRNVLELARSPRIDLAWLKEVGTYAQTFT